MSGKQVELFSFKKMDFTSKLFLLLGIIMLIPLIMLIPFSDEYIYIFCFLLPAMITMLIGLLINTRTPNGNSPKFFGRPHETVVVVGIWMYAFLIGTTPFLLSDQLGFVGALFESVSGWTTTGLSVMDVEATPNIFLFYRSFMQFCGGLGFVMLMLLFASGSSAMELFSAEGHPDKLEPNLRSTAKTMMFIYLGFTASGTVLYMLFGMNWFDAINHAMTALSTGGFSTRVDSIGYYQSLPIELITFILMLLGTTNFAILALLIKGDFKKFSRIGEMKFLFMLLIIAIPAIAFAGTYEVYSSFNESLRISAFQAISALSTTGFSTVTYDTWHPNMLFVMILLMLVGGGAGSTAGGIKFSRVYVLCKSLTHSLKTKFIPERSVNEDYIYKPQGKVYLTPKYVLEITRFAFAYIIIYMIGTLLITFAGVPIDKAMFEFASSLGTVGLSIGLTGVGTSSYILIVEIFGMILGRLEIFIVLISLISIFKKLIDIVTQQKMNK